MHLIVALATAIAVLTGCASWDKPSTTTNLARDLTHADSSTVTWPARVGDLSEVEPVTAHAKPALPVELTDADGNDVVVTDTSRILALDLYGTYTKTLRGLGLSDSIVGRTVSSTEASLADRPLVTAGGHDINVEAVLNLHPTLVIVDHSIGPPEAIENIRAAGVPTVVMQPTRSLSTLGQDIRDLAAVVGLPQEGERLAERSEKELTMATDSIAAIAPQQPLRMAFLYARGTGGVFYILGQENGTNDLISALGGIDVASEAGIGAPSPASPEALAKLNPDVFVMMTKGLESTGDIDGLLARPGVANTSAGANRRVLTLPDGDSLAFGPQTAELLLRAAQAIYGGSQ
ncbi:MAG: ABC transporter substrate-binding protein [Corynebacterium glucuronolyticum]|nr:ABC transporter substrate-binding protein [Corynebacterium glucuronolyticum]